MLGGPNTTSTNGTGINVKIFEAKTGKYLDSQLFQCRSKPNNPNLISTMLEKIGKSHTNKVQSVNTPNHDVSGDVINTGIKKNKKVIKWTL